MKGFQDIREKELIERARGGDRGAMESIYRSYSGYLNAVCSRYVTDGDEARDVLQESFIRIFSSLDKFEYRGEGSLKGWMSRIVVNRSLKLLRSHKRSLTLAGADIPDVADDSDPGFDGVPEKVIMDMIRSLPEGYRTVFNLHVLEDLPHKEIGRLLGIKENSSASQYHRARAILAKQITEYKKTHC